HHLDASGQQVLLALEVGIEGRAADVRAVDDVLHGQRLEAFLPDERDHRRSQHESGSVHSPVVPGLRHGVSPRHLAGRSMSFCPESDECRQVVRSSDSLPNIMFINERGVHNKTIVRKGGILMDRSARHSMVSVALATIFITVNHLFSIGPGAYVLGAAIAVTAGLFLWWLRRTNSTAAFAGYLLVNLWIIVGFGLIKGLWGITLPLFAGT